MNFDAPVLTPHTHSPVFLLSLQLGCGFFFLFFSTRNFSSHLRPVKEVNKILFSFFSPLTKVVFGPPPNYAFMILLQREDEEVPRQLQLCNEEWMRVREFTCVRVTWIRCIYYTDRADTIQNASLGIDFRYVSSLHISAVHFQPQLSILSISSWSYSNRFPYSALHRVTTSPASRSESSLGCARPGDPRRALGNGRAQ